MTSLKPSKPFTQREAIVFVKNVLEDIFPNGKVAEVKNIYTPDVVGHYKDEVFGRDEIENRVRAIRDYTKDCNFKVQEVIRVSDEIITFSCKQSWRDKAHNTFHNLLVFGVYKMRKRKVAEVWMILDIDAKRYSEINKDFTNNMREFEHHQKTKEDFFYKLTIQNNLHTKLSIIEQECLYYYFHGFSAKETALEMRISPRTVESHIADIKDKFACRTKHELRRKIFPKPR